VTKEVRKPTLQTQSNQWPDLPIRPSEKVWVKIRPFKETQT
jgi:hypothetical protein